jgi:dTDP-4-dehydrorhamnose reductase
MNHLVVGANGNIGSALFSRLKASGAAVWGTSKRSCVESQENIIAFNLLEPSFTWSFANHNFDVAYLCAGVCRMALCEDDPIGTSKINIDGMTNLAKYLAEKGTFIVFLSTNQVFSGESSHVLEEASYQPLNEYGRQKAVVEQYIREHCPRSAIVRLTKVVEPKMQLIQQWIEKLQQHEPLDAFHDMTLAPVALRQVLDVLVKVGEAKRPGCYQVSGAKDVSYFELAKYVAKRLGASEDLVRSVSALDKGIKKTFLPRFTTLSCSSTIALCEQKPPSFSEVVQECFEIDNGNSENSTENNNRKNKQT